MSNLLYILTNILLPLFIPVGLAFVIQKKMKLDIKSLVKVHIFVFLPSLMFKNIYFNTLSGELIFQVITFTVTLFLVLILTSTLAARLFSLERSKEKAFVNGCSLMNQGNYGIPLITLLFAGTNSEYAISIQMTVLLTMSILINTIGLYNTSSGSYKGIDAIKNVFKMPLIYVILIGFILKSFSIELWPPITSTVLILAQAVVPLALFILGAQLAETEIKITNPFVYVANVFRLIISPIIAFGLIKLFGINGILAQVLIIGAAFPTAINSVILSIQFKGDHHYASQTVFTSTLLSSLTVTVIISLVLKYIT